MFRSGFMVVRRSYLCLSVTISVDEGNSDDDGTHTETDVIRVCFKSVVSMKRLTSDQIRKGC